MFYNLTGSMSARMKFDGMCHQCGMDDANATRIEELRALTKEDITDRAKITWEAAVTADQIGVSDEDDYPMTVDDLEEAGARWMSEWASGFENKRNEMISIYHLNEDWDRFEEDVRAELAKLGATEEEVKQILDGAWEAATEVEDVARFASDELDLLRG